MKCLILAAGYATRLYPLTENFPKSLLEVKEKTILDWLIDDIDSLQMVEEYIVISNHKFADLFARWASAKTQRITVVDDQTTSNETRLGAVKDIQFALDCCQVEDDILVIAGDNLLDFSLTAFLQYAKEKKTSCIMRYFEAEREKLKKSGVVCVDETDRIVTMEEKPAEPKSNWCCPPFYYYKKEDTKRIAEGIACGCGVDAPGSYVAWLCTKTTIHAMEMPGKRYDIGTLESYQKVQAEYLGIEHK